MFDPLLVLTIIVGYMVLLIFVAGWAQRLSNKSKFISSPWIYSLTIAIYCTSWTFYGSVGVAANSGILFLAIYLGPTLVLMFGHILLKKLVRLKSRFHITSIADLISARYNKSQSLAALVTLMCLIGVVPYIALQLKAVVATFELMIGSASVDSRINIETVTVLLMIIFTIFFGVRRLDPTERHQGMMVVLAAESIIKLVAFVAAGLFVTFGIFDGFADLFQQVEQSAVADLDNLSNLPALSNWVGLLIIAMCAFMVLPRQFHVMVVENSDEHHISTAQWVLPGYLLLINIFVLPIAAAGLLMGYSPQDADTFVLQLPMLSDQRMLSMLVFIGGFSAATGMILISAMTLSTMITNHLVLPLLDSVKSLHGLRTYILQWRWLSVTLFIFAGSLFNQTIGGSYMLVNMGLISFAAVSQFAPAIVGGLFWRRGNTKGALAGLTIGFITWAYTLLLPALVKSGWLAGDLLNSGLFGWSLLMPEQLLGMSLLDPLAHSTFWSLGLNVLFYILVSNLSRVEKDEQVIADDFVDIMVRQNPILAAFSHVQDILISQKVSRLDHCFSAYLSHQNCQSALTRCLTVTGLENRQYASLIEIAYLQKEAENVLAGAVGGAVAHRAILRSELFSDQEQEALSAVYSKILAKIHLTPEELTAKIDFHQEREKLLSEHAMAQTDTIARLETEITQRQDAEKSLKDLNERLELLVGQRTEELQSSNQDLRTVLSDLQIAQKQLVESEKMASLGGLVAGIAHEINTPLGISMTAVTFLDDELDDIVRKFESNTLKRSEIEEFNKNTSEGLKILHSNITKASQLVRNFKMVAVDQTDDKLRRFDITKYIEEVIFSLKPMLKKNHIQVELDSDSDLFIESYPGAIAQIITNLAVNSVQHGFDKRDSGLIKIGLRQEDELLMIHYSDDGSGMDEQDVKKVFDPFFTTTRGRGGTGLGAHIIYNLVSQRLKGVIFCKSKPGAGTEFDIRIPVTGEESPQLDPGFDPMI